MALYRSAYLWFILLLVVSVTGFWRSYFSQIFSGDLHYAHHLHGLSMVVWVCLLITQSWLIRNRHNARHKAIGKASLAVAPVVVVSGTWVNFHFIANGPDPAAPFVLSIFWYGFFLVAAFAVLYALAIHHRRRVQLHARYMAATALVFIQPGLGRAVDNYIAPLGVWTPTFFQITWVSLIIGIWMMSLDIRNRKNYRPWALFNAMWVANLVIWLAAPHIGFWRTFTLWAAGGSG